MLDDPWQDRAIPVRFHDEDASVAAIVDAARRRPIDGVLAVGDRPAVIAARAAAALGLPRQSADAAAAARNKRLRARAASRRGLPVPWFRRRPRRRGCRARSPRSRLSRASSSRLALSGSRGVMRADDPDGVRARVRARARAARAAATCAPSATRPGRSHPRRRLHPGREFAVEGRADRRRAAARSRSSTSPIRSTARSSRRRST